MGLELEVLFHTLPLKIIGEKNNTQKVNIFLNSVPIRNCPLKRKFCPFFYRFLMLLSLVLLIFASTKLPQYLWCMCCED